MKRYGRFLTRHPWWVLGLLVVGTLAALHGVVDLRSGVFRLEVDPSVDSLLPEGDEDRLFYDRARKLFGGDEFVLLMIEADDLFSADKLARIQRITERVEKEVPGVHRVLSLANATQIEGDAAGDLYVGPFFETVPSDPAALEALRQKAISHPIYGGSLVAKDGRAAAILAYFDRIPERKFMEQRLSEKVLAIGDQEKGEGARVFVTGAPHVKLAMSQIIVDGLGYILPAIVALCLLLSFVAFRTLRGLLLPILTIALAVIWTLGLMGWTSSALNLVSNMVPPLIITLGFAAAMHFVSEYYEVLNHHEARDRASHREAVGKVIEEMGLAVFVNGLTTALGFASIAISTVPAIRSFGVWSVVGVLATTVAALTFIPALLVVLGPARRLPRTPGEGRIDRWAVALAYFDVRNRNWIFAAAIVGLLISLYGATKITVSNDYVTAFREHVPARLDYEAINERLGGASAFFIVVEGDEEGAFAQPDNLRALRELQDWLEQQPEIGKTMSLADSVMLLNQAFQGNAPSAHTIPDRMRLVKQLLLFGGEDVTKGLVDATYRTANVNARTTEVNSGPVSDLLKRIDERLAQLPKRLSARVTGDLVLLNKTQDDVARGQIQSIALALLTIYLALAAMLTSFRVGLIAMLPNLLPIAAFYGALGFSGWPLNMTTSLVAEIALGIAVDDTVHYFTRFSLEARRLGDERQATASTLRSVIRPVTFTTIAICAGFLLFTLTDLRTQAQFAILCAFTLAVGWVLELTLSPALCSRVRLVTLWDLLALDLGENPERSIPLFEGLTSRQARIFALMSNLVTAKAGSRLLTEGEKGEEMFVVVDGELSASLERNGARHQLTPSKRGDVVGEVAMFAGSRTADVDVVRDTRLLRFGEAELERLGRRYPKIAAVVYRNLSRILASRVINTIRTLG